MRAGVVGVPRPHWEQFPNGDLGCPSGDFERGGQAPPTIPLTYLRGEAMELPPWALRVQGGDQGLTFLPPLGGALEP